MKKAQQRVVFFDLDGTLHKQDLFGSYLRYCLVRQPLNLLPLLLLIPLIAGGLLVCGRASRWPVSLLLWSVTVGHSEAFLQRQQQAFCRWFRPRVIPFPDVHRRLNHYLQATDTSVWLITGSPVTLVESVYHQSSFLPAVNIIGSQMRRSLGGRVLTLRCIGKEKVRQLERQLGSPLRLYSGYSDSRQDNPLMACCSHRWRVTARGEIEPLGEG
ncbi:MULTISPECIES: phosphatidylglycerophosphatase C [Tatumella]|uniref:Phosphatidylglycerophosphatase C n=1 Tax=Tatumella punctata TaxID=399969 RepID=A0ABW1VPM6_9GAMM|nr:MULTISPECIES: phosphatidylglycerophosphatase C [unclassified Tatumella]MBS0856965.1 acid phosphatase AphA [Tatumella sp. JGM16]MBS0878205.1 acid phosphatase AphA [Tatumella sp. JGM82]MBS0891707.1 acid phosphatase AphA [Tatumella sp. JGM94]MBS0893915.1 acid phosphatase AphA [Tatumella sp. JGM130]MBS0902933.1 acid phosphatase AphA [Tatumella sp. JGM100]